MHWNLTWQVNCILFCTLQILNEISQHKIKIYEFPDTEDEEETKLHKVLKDRVPFAVVGSNTVIEVDGKKIRGRKYPWGIAEGAYCNFTLPTYLFRPTLWVLDCMNKVLCYSHCDM